MTLQVWRFICVLLAALGLTMGGAHVLELTPRMHYDAQLYTAVTSTLYRYYGIVGGVIQVSALASAAVLAWLVKDRPSFRLTLAGALCLAAALGVWAWLVQPVNAEWGRALLGNAASAPEAYLRLRDRWEFGHAAAFTAWLLGFLCLLLSVLSEIRRQRPDGPVA